MCKKQTDSKGKPLGGKGFRANDELINKLQNYYGIAIRENAGTSVYKMKTAIAAVLHCCSEATTEDTNIALAHQALGANFKLILQTIQKHKPTPGLQEDLRKIIEPVFRDLSSDTLLSKCLHGGTQNNNEALNGIIWRRCPIDIYVRREVLEMGVSSPLFILTMGHLGLEK